MVVAKTFRIGISFGGAQAVALLNVPEMGGYMDIYTKIVLTIIAVALSIIALREVGVPALAQSSAPVRVVICGEEANPNAGQFGCARILTSNQGVGRLLIAQ
jgi:hypothetical protein